jgi:arylsulfatase
MVPDTATGGLTGVTTYKWTQVGNILRDPFEIAVGNADKTALGYGGGLAAPSTAYIYNWNMLPIGQLLWLKELESYVAYPPMQDPASYNLSQVLQQIKRQGHSNPSE